MRHLLIISVLWVAGVASAFASMQIGYKKGGYGNNHVWGVTTCAAWGATPYTGSICAYQGDQWGPGTFDNGCASGQVAPTGVITYQIPVPTCVAVCATDSNISASDPSCAPPPDPCAERSGESVTGELFRCQLTPPINSQSVCPAGTSNPSTFAIDGCHANVTGVTTCNGYADGKITCVYSGVLDGTASNGSESPLASGSGAVPVPPAPSPVSCPAGYGVIYDNGVVGCLGPSSPGTPSTPESPGSPPVPGAKACPVGYSITSDGQSCVGPAPTNGYGCPDGSAPVSGHCVVDLPPDDIAADKPEGATGPEKAAVNNAADDLVARTGAPNHGWTWAPPIPTAQCFPWVISAGGRTMTIDPCPVAQKLRELFAFCLYVGTAFGLFSLLFRKES